MRTIINYIGRVLCLSLALSTIAPTQAAPRIYPKGGTCDMEKVYGVNKNKDLTLRALNYTQAMAVDSFPAFAAYWQARGWPTAELLDLYLFECAWNDWVWHTDTYLDIGIYIRNNFVTQSRGWIKAPDGWYRVRFGCMTGLGHYEGKHPNVYSDRTGANPGCTPGTAIEIDHAGWSIRQPERNCIFASCWGMDYGLVGGMAYSEGVIIEYFRVNGGRVGGTTDPSFVSNGITMSHPGENSAVRYCMAEGFNNAGFAIIGGTPGMVEVCSAFYNCGPGIDFLGNNGLTNMTVIKPSGDNNRGGLMRSRPMNAGSVGGGTFTLIDPKEESRNTLQRLFVSEGNLGQLTLNIVGGTADYSGVTCPELIRIEKGNSWAVDVTGLEFSSGVESLVYHAESGKRLSGGTPFIGNTFGINYEGLYLKSFGNMVLTTGTTPPPTGSWTCGAWGTCVNGSQSRTCTHTDGSTRVETQGCQVAPPTSTMTATASLVSANAGKAVDGDAGTFWQADRSMASGQWFQVDLGASRAIKGVTFTVPYPAYPWWPPKYDVQVSANGTAWTNAATNLTGAATSTATFTATGRYVRIVCKASQGNWWGINTLTVQ